MSAKTKDSKKESGSTVARSEDGTIQITFTIPFSKIAKTREDVAKELGKDIEVPGFRRGMAPLSKLIEHIPQQTLLEKTLSKILPDLVTKSIDEHKIAPAIYPKFELVKAVDDEDWQIRATTCELPKITLGDYKKEISAEARSKSLWTPGKGDAKEKKEQTHEEKEQEVINILVNKTEVKIPYILIDEEATNRLSKLLERLEKLGLSLESYLASIGKTAEALRTEYESQAIAAIKLDLILNEIALKENITVDVKEIDSAVGAAQADRELAKELNTPERRRFIEVILRRRKALESLTSLL